MAVGEAAGLPSGSETWGHGEIAEGSPEVR